MTVYLSVLSEIYFKQKGLCYFSACSRGTALGREAQCAGHSLGCPYPSPFLVWAPLVPSCMWREHGMAGLTLNLVKSGSWSWSKWYFPQWLSCWAWAAQPQGQAQGRGSRWRAKPSLKSLEPHRQERPILFPHPHPTDTGSRVAGGCGLWLAGRRARSDEDTHLPCASHCPIPIGPNSGEQTCCFPTRPQLMTCLL